MWGHCLLMSKWGIFGIFHFLDIKDWRGVPFHALNSWTFKRGSTSVRHCICLQGLPYQTSQLGGLNNESHFPMVWSLEVQDQYASKAGVWHGLCLWVVNCCLVLCTHEMFFPVFKMMVVDEEHPISFSSHKDQVLWIRAQPLWPQWALITFIQALFPNTATMCIRVSSYKCWGTCSSTSQHWITVFIQIYRNKQMTQGKKTVAVPWLSLATASAGQWGA